MWYTLAMHRLLVPEELMSGDTVTLPADAARHLKVVRPRPGETVELFDGRGHTRRCRWEGGRLLADGPAAAFPPPPTELVLFACVTKGSRWDWPIALALVKSCGRVFAGALCNPPPPPIWDEVAAVAGGDVPSLGIFVGPEGDFTPEELRALLEIAAPVSFGPTILRAETAAIFGLSVLAAASHAS